MSKFIISCGGTGGHLAPGLAVGQALIEAGHEVSFIISRKHVDARLVEKYSDLHILKAPGVAFSLRPTKFLKFIKEFFKALKFGRETLKNGNYDVVISFGGFNSLGLSIAAAMMHIPIVLHEANRKAGKATKLLGRFARRIFIPHGVKIPRRKSGQVKYAGYPIRGEIKKLDATTSKETFGFPSNSKLILMLGGSQGAKALNDWANDNFEKLAEAGMDILCVCGPGKTNYQNRTHSDANGVEHSIKFLEFCDNMACAMSASDIVIARAGAGTIAELARCRVPSIMVPYPFAADNHQLENALCFEKQGACVVVQQNNLESLYPEVIELMSNDTLKESMQKNLERVDELNDISKIVEDLAKIAKEARK